MFGPGNHIRPNAVRSVEETMKYSRGGFDYICIATKVAPFDDLSLQKQIKPALGTFPAVFPPKQKRVTSRLATILGNYGANSLHEEDIQGAWWRKLLVNGSQNPICALSHLRDAQFLRSDSEAVPFLRNVMAEIATVAQSKGYTDIDNTVVDHQMEASESRALPGNTPSMMVDALSGRRLEVESILGNTVRIA
ncbi:ketopantoate reductase family protein [Aspergillus affinis]|uniref:ketopantoate reductase family protein n=1 Tax=Aspergillus affinis TaxID=1070780 RepID=UPI0022FEBF03|nr:uncharacterized protein KD926_008862 [Aspergillus affinis]KAI9045435.1 hypothetical protein KD926_008862 [Aspergillus affinis]